MILKTNVDQNVVVEEEQEEMQGASSKNISSPFLIRKIDPINMLTDEAAEVIENNAETVLEEIGIDFLEDPESIKILKTLGVILKEKESTFQKALQENIVLRHQSSLYNLQEIKISQLQLVLKIQSLHLCMALLL